jgi:hypothetical protein
MNPNCERTKLSATWDIRMVDATTALPVCTKVDVAIETCPDEVASYMSIPSVQYSSAFWVQTSTFAVLQDVLMQE